MTEPVDKKPTAPRKSPLATLDEGEGIPVQLLRFHRANGLDVPGKTGANSLKAQPRGPEGGYAITYLPRIRHHRIVHTPGNSDKPPVTFYVHETWASWEAAD